MSDSSSDHSYNLRQLMPGPNFPPPKNPKPNGRVLGRPRAAVACETCRKRKVRCDGGRPKCSACTRSCADCIYVTSMVPTTQVQELKRKYDDLEQEATAHQRLLQLMQSRGHEEAIMIFQKIRQGVDAQTLLRLVETGDLFSELSLVPQTAFRYEFPFLQEMPSFLKSPDNPYLQSPIFEWSARPNEPSSSQLDTGSSSVNQVQPPAPYLKPYHAAEVIDPLLESSEPSKWTNVTNDNVLMRKLLRAYILHDYQWNPFFQKDYFFEDMAAGRDTFCSELLVNAILALGCYCFRDLRSTYEFWNPSSLGYQFLAEAKRLWEIDSVSGRNKLPTIQAGPMITLAYGFTGADKLGWRYTQEVITMAQELQLFATPTIKRSQKIQGARDFTAWAIFLWQSIYAYHSLCRPLIEKPPVSPLPDPALFSQWYGDIWIRYPLNSTIFSTNLGHFFKARVEFLVLLNEIGLQSFGKDGPLVSPNTSELYALYVKLESWLKGLPEFLSAPKISLPNHLKLHMHYYYAVMYIFRPAARGTEIDPATALFSQGVTMQRAREILLDAKICFETLLRIYYLRHGFDGLDSFLLAYLVFWSFETMDQINSSTDAETLDSMRSTLLLCAKGLYEQGRIYFLARTMFQLVYRRMRKEDMDLFGQYVTFVGDDDQQDKRNEYLQSQWPIRTVNVGKTNKKQTLHELMDTDSKDEAGELSE